jgi:polymorphic membrane protein
MLLLCAVAIPVQATTITVTNNNDSGPGSLRQALADVNDGDTINFAVTGTIGLTSGELVIDKSVTISGPGPDLLAVSGSYQQFIGVFHVMSGHTVTIEGLTVSNGYGGIYNDHATLTVSNCTVQYNRADWGGGIYNDAYYQGSATLTIVNSTISGNCACGGGAYGGGIYSDGTLTIINTTVSGNAAITPSPEEGYGGGIYAGGGALTISGSTITGNFASLWGGGINGGGTITNSTISGNTAGGGNDHRPGQGGGIFGGGTIRNTTITGNTAWGDDFKGPGLGGGIYAGGTIMNSIISYNSATEGANIYFGVASQGYNVCSDDCGGYLNGPGDQINTDPLLGPLQDNGGLTFTHELLPGSPAIDAGNPRFTPPPIYDQRGPSFRRVRNRRIDIGSFEVQAGQTPRPRPTPPPRPTPRLRP